MQEDTNSISEDPTLLTDTYSYFTSYLLSDKKPDTMRSLIQTKTTLLKKLQKFEALVTNCQNIDDIQSANGHIQTGVSVLNQQSTENATYQANGHHQIKTLNIIMFSLQKRKGTVLLPLC